MTHQGNVRQAKPNQPQGQVQNRDRHMQSERSASKDDDVQLTLPMNKTLPVVLGVIVLAVVAVIGGAVFFISSRKQAPNVDYAAELDKARSEANKVKQQQQQQLEHLQQAEKAWQIASEQQANKAAPSPSDSEASDKSTPQQTKNASKAASSAAKTKSTVRSSDLDQLDKLGTAVNSELGK